MRTLDCICCARVLRDRATCVLDCSDGSPRTSQSVGGLWGFGSPDMMDQFVRRQNVDRYRRLLELATDEPRRGMIVMLLAEEQHMPLLRWPHDRHRGLCTRRGAEAQAINRHVMNSRLMPDQTDAHPHRWPAAGIATAHAADTKWRLSHLLDPSVCAANRRRLMPSGHKYRCARASGLTRAARLRRLTGRAQPQSP